MGSTLASLLLLLGLIVAGILLLIFVAVPLFRGLGSLIGFIFRGIGWLFTHVFEFIGGMCKDAVRFVGSIIAMLILMPLVPINVIIGRWSGANHFAQSVKREAQVGLACVYRVLLKRPLKLLLLDGLLEGLEQRVPQAVADAPTGDTPSHRTGRFEGYEITGSLRSGGSGAKLYIAKPIGRKKVHGQSLPEQVVIKSFAISDGSTLPQIVRESRALECAKQMGLVVDHGMDAHRFFYVMPYIPGQHLGVVARQLHGESDGDGLAPRELAAATKYMRDLLETLSCYHKGGLWHKDVKPENVIVHHGRAHLVDLGLVTPLRSAMTLTTHGTEYFRDPEMVRQALRGVKVHQVDGAKFDVYAVGAVLYFMLENEFPAHGALSAFGKKSPESLRWIVRRAMADYTKRYATCDAMLADLEFAASSSDPFTVKLADLPSMRGSDAPEIPQPARPVEVMAAAGAPAAVEGFGVAAGVGERGPFAQVGAFKVDSAGNPMPPSDSSVGGAMRPRLKVTNWWTGEYVVEAGAPIGMVPGGENMSHDAREFRRQARAFREEAQGIAGAAAVSGQTARRAAREQIKAARTRATEMRRKIAASRSRHFPAGDRQPSPAVVGMTLLVLVIGGLVVMPFFVGGESEAARAQKLAVRVASYNSALAMITPAEPELIDLREELADLGDLQSVQFVDASELSSDDARSALARQHINNALGSQCVLAEADSKLARSVRKQLPRLKKEQHVGDIDQHLSTTEISHLLVFTGDEKDPLIIYGRHSGSGEPGTVPPPAKSMIVINDVPAPIDPKVQAAIEKAMEKFAKLGFTPATVDTEIEAELRTQLAQSQINPENAELEQQLHDALAAQNLDAMLLLHLKPGEGEPYTRLLPEMIHVKRPAAPAPVPPAAPETPAPAGSD